MGEDYALKQQRMRDHCEHEHYFGPDMENPFKLQQLVGQSDDATFYWYDQEGKQHAVNRHTDVERFPLLKDFTFAPTSEAQLRSTEETLGFALPQLLREMYRNVANGGFGPGYGINGVAGGFGEILLVDYLSMKQTHRLVDIAVYERRQQPAKLLKLPFYVFPDHFLQLCHWGCAIYSYLDCASGRVFRGSYYRDFYGLQYETDSLYQWLDLWAQGMDLWSRSGLF